MRLLQRNTRVMAFVLYMLMFICLLAPTVSSRPVSRNSESLQLTTQTPHPGSKTSPALDRRNFANGYFRNFGYSDQLYCVVAANNSASWLCVVTMNPHKGEGAKGEVVVSMVTRDYGATWSSPLAIEPGITVPMAYGVPVLLDSGRVAVIYNLNEQNTTKFPNGKRFPGRNDEMGHFYMRWTDDFGATWSRARSEVPYRNTFVDDQNPFKGAVRFMWTVDKPSLHGGAVTLAFTKIGNYPQAPPEEVFLLRSPDLNRVPDPANATWQLLPEGEHGVRNPRSALRGVCEEGHQLKLAAAPQWLVVFRTGDGYLAEASSADQGLSFGPSQYTHYCQVGAEPLRAVKQPRGPFTPREVLATLSDPPAGRRFVMIFYDDGVQWSGSDYNRNPYWLVAGREVPMPPTAGVAGPANSTVCWSQPELAIYDPSENEVYEGAGGYADFVMSQSEPADLNITLTNKTAAAVVRPPRALLQGLLGQLGPRPPARAAREGLVWDLTPASSECSPQRLQCRATGACCVGVGAPPLPDLRANDTSGAVRPGLTLELWANVSYLPPQVLVSAFPVGASCRGAEACGEGRPAGEDSGGSVTVSVARWSTTQQTTLAASMTDGTTSFRYVMDSECAARMVEGGRAHQAALVLDGGPRAAMWTVDGVLCDGGPKQLRGFAWWPLAMGDLQQGQVTRLGASSTWTVVKAPLRRFRYYTRALRTAELVASFRAGPAPAPPRTWSA